MASNATRHAARQIEASRLKVGGRAAWRQGSRVICLPHLSVGTERELVTVRLADNAEQRNSSRMLINKMYSWRGYGDNHVIPHTPNHITFTASAGAETVGTITLAIDSAVGLAADVLFAAEINLFRNRSGVKVCELTKFAFDTGLPAKPLLASMFHLVYIYGQRKHACTDLFIEVNPRHVRFYEVMLGFEKIGELKFNDGVNAPSQLLHLEIKKVRQQIDEVAGNDKNTASRSLYTYFFSANEEDGIYSRMI